MDLKGHTVLVTGGATGIGFAIVEYFLQAGSQVIICGRREDKLKEAKQKYSNLHYYVSDVSSSKDRKELASKVIKDFPKLDVLINNAGIQDRIHVNEFDGNWERHHNEIAINLEAPIHLAMLLVPHLRSLSNSAIINISSGLAFVPLIIAPVYSATKAALHSFTLSLRQQLKETSVKVIEIIPPAVQTDLGGSGLHNFGVPLQEFAEGVMKKLKEGEIEIGYGFSEKSRNASRAELNEIFNQMNNR
jgi:uncharacterized oxidoreductase